MGRGDAQMKEDTLAQTEVSPDWPDGFPGESGGARPTSLGTTVGFPWECGGARLSRRDWLARGPNTDTGPLSLPRVGLVLLVDQLDRGTLTLGVRSVRTRRTFVL